MLTTRPASRPLLLTLFWGSALLGCESSDENPVTPGSGTSGSAGTFSTGGVGGTGAGGTGPSAGNGTGGAVATGGATSAGSSSGGTGGGGGATSTGGASTGGAGSGGTPSGGAGAGADNPGGTSGASMGGRAGASMGGRAGASAGGRGGGSPGTCTKSVSTGKNASGTGPHDVIVETNSDPGINEGTIFRPADLGGSEKYPIFVWGQGACSKDGLANATAMAEIASHGYFVVADGTPNGTGNRVMDRSQLAAMGAPLVAYIDWALSENDKPCSAYYQSLDATKIASNGFSCGGLMAQGTVLDPRIVTWGVTSSGMAGANQAFYDLIHTPVLFVEGGMSDIAYDGALGGYEAISDLDVPVLWFSKNIGHGGDLFQPDGGDFTKINLAWLNWWLKGDMGATGKGLLVGASCRYCTDSAWEVMSANVP
ncbi:MAG TPA: hypothetical protein VFZ53_10410 [Polyangiaceae bacterium]